jgi:hypothetical protein
MQQAQDVLGEQLGNVEHLTSCRACFVNDSKDSLG